MIHPLEMINNAATVVGYFTMFTASLTAAVAGMTLLLKKVGGMVLEVKKLEQVIVEPLPSKTARPPKKQTAKKTVEISNDAATQCIGQPTPPIPPPKVGIESYADGVSATRLDSQPFRSA